MIFDGQPITRAQFAAIRDTVNAPENPIIYLAIDPGKANGICGYDKKFYVQFMYTIREEDMIEFLNQFEKVETCIIEDFLLYPDKAQQQIYSTMETSRVIGRTEGWAARNGIKLIKQGARIKKTGYMWIGVKQPSKSNRNNHKMDAHVHFMYWAIKNGKIDARKLINRPTE